jgi:hypothetical protein
MAKDAITMNTLHIGTQMYADDVSDIKVITNNCENNNFQEVLDDRNKEMDETLETMDMAQHRDKEEHIVSMNGKNRIEDLQEIKKRGKERREATRDFGLICYQCKYLGTVTEADGKTKKFTDKRIAAVRESFYALQGFWPRQDLKPAVNCQPSHRRGARREAPENHRCNDHE